MFLLSQLSCLGFASDCQYRLKRYDSVRTRFVLMCIAVHLNRIAVGDCRDGILIYSYQEVKIITNIRVSLNKAHPLLYVCMHVGCT